MSRTDRSKDSGETTGNKNHKKRKEKERERERGQELNSSRRHRGASSLSRSSALAVGQPPTLAIRLGRDIRARTCTSRRLAPRGKRRSGEPSEVLFNNEIKRGTARRRGVSISVSRGGSERRLTEEGSEEKEVEEDALSAEHEEFEERRRLLDLHECEEMHPDKTLPPRNETRLLQFRRDTERERENEPLVLCFGQQRVDETVIAFHESERLEVSQNGGGEPYRTNANESMAKKERGEGTCLEHRR